MNTYVIDTSVAVKWLFEEPHRQAAKQYLNAEIRQIAPELIVVEFANAIRRKYLYKQITQTEGDRAIEIFLRRKDIYFSKLYSSNDLVARAFEISKEIEQHPIPDCVYLALAEKEQGILVTADKVFFDKVQRSSHSNLITWVEKPPIISKK